MTGACRLWPLVLLLVLAAPATAGAACTAKTQVEVERPSRGLVEIKAENPCWAGRLVHFMHNGERVSRLADEAGLVVLFRLLDEGEDRIELLEGNGEPQTVFDEAAEDAAPDASAAEPAAGSGTAIRGDEARAALLATAPAVARDVAACRFLTLRPDNQDGLVRLAVESTCEGGSVVKLEERAHGLRLYGRLDETGGTDFVLPLLRLATPIEVDVEHGPQSHAALIFSETDSLNRVVLAWQDAVDLDLVVREPGGAVGPDAPEGTGRIERRDDGDGSGTKLESYALPARALRSGTRLGLAVVHKSRGRVPEPPFCGPGSEVRFRLLMLTGGQVRERRMVLPAAACGVPLNDAAYAPVVGDLRLR